MIIEITVKNDNNAIIGKRSAYDFKSALEELDILESQYKSYEAELKSEIEGNNIKDGND